MDRIINDYYSRSPIPLTAPAGWTPPTLDGAVIKGAHQRRMTSKCVEKALKALKKNGFSGIKQKGYNNFEELYADVRNTLITVSGIGSLTCYDVALRLGRFTTPWITPKDYVYVAQGALVGAHRLLGRDVVKKALIDEVKLPVSLFATLFPNIPAAHIEDMLCIYKTYFVTGGACKKFPSASSNGACASSASTHRRPTSCSGGGICGSNSNP